MLETRVAMAERAKRQGLAALALLGALALAPRAAAEAPNEKKVCLAAYEDAQRLRFAAKLVGAREKLRVCRRDVCPSLVRSDCEKWLGEVAESLPSVVLSARDPSGRDLFDVNVALDGAPLASGLAGTALDVDPGTHTIRFTRGADTYEEKLLVRQGEHNRVIVGVLGSTAPKPAVGATEPQPGPGVSPRGVVGLVLGGAGLVTLGVSGVLGLTSNGDASGLRETCGVTQSCTQEQVDAIAGRRTVAGVLAGVGGAMVITGVVLFVTAPSASAAAASVRGPRTWWALGAAPVPGGAAASLRAAF